ncbi:MAG: AAA family ATPase [Chlamydiia bacterium]|nr:AAA family ATPase [Chlamydiia bacterium]MCB9092824.1 AAA family ATPase [Halobacteriovoraceae bacterium]
MPIGFGRVEFIKRSEGRNACQLSAYLSRSCIFFEGNCALEPKLYDFSHREIVSHHEIILPEGADENLRIPEVLWNLAERKEVRKDAQVSMHLVLALPDDKEITLEDRIELTRGFIQKHYNGLVAESVIHPPERKIEFTEENEALGIPKGTLGTVIEEKNGNYIVSLTKGVRPNPFIEIGTKCPGIAVQEHNWHAHAQLSTRRLKANGKEFEDLKATDLMPVVKKGKVISGPDVGKLWAQHQNAFFLSKGLALRVDDNGLVPQEHLGPVRMRGRAFALLEEHAKRLELNEIAASDPQNILNVITKRQSVFTKDDVERFMLKHVPGDKIQEVREGFWKLEDLVQLRSLETKEFVSKFTSEEVIQEEEQILRLADRIYDKPQKVLSKDIQNKFTEGLSKEQREAYHHILDGKGLSCIQGYAGTGKSYLLKSLKGAYEERGLIVRSFGPDNATANVLKEKGFTNAENIYRFLFSAKHGLRNLHKGFEVWVLDEAGKLGNRPLLEFLKLAEAKGAKVILAGDSSQLPSVERGGVFKTFCERYGSEVLEDIQRQKDESARSMAKNLAKGEVGEALDKLSNRGALSWSLTRKEAIENLVLKWAGDHQEKDSGKVLGKDSSLIIAGTNDEVRVLNEMVRLVRKERGEVSEQEFACQTAHGTVYVSNGDRIEFRKNDRDLGVTNGMSGILLKAEKSRFSVAVQEHGKKTRIVSFNPEEYHRFQLGYASTCSRAQGKTVQNAYVLHSPHLNKQMAYVGLTRHVKDVHYFVSKEDALNLSDLKRKALRDGSKATTLEYTHTREIEGALSLEKREDTIQSLKESEHFSKRFKAAALSLWDRFNEKTYAYLEKKYDRKPDQKFFNFKEEKQELGKTTVREISKQELKELSIVPVEASEKISPQEVVEKISIQDKDIEKNKETVKMKNIAMEIEKDLYDKGASPSDASKSIEKSTFTWKDLPKEERKLFSSYFNAASKAYELREVVQAECGESLESASKSPYFQEWQKACALRNQSAYQLKPLLSKEEHRGILKEKSVYYIETHAKKHEGILKAQEQRALQAEKMKDLDGQLASHVEPLLYKLFPDGPSSKTAKSYRFGAKGSLSVTHSGPKSGQFYDFERQEGGGLLKLISRELKLDSQETRVWAGEFLGIASEIKLPVSFQKPATSYEKESDWVSVKPDPKVPAPKLEEQGKLTYYYSEVMRHPYRDEKGNLLYYVTRLQDKNNPSRKITPPLSYGYFKDNPKELSWKRRGYKDENGKKPLYNLHLLREKPLSPVLIVEGEKTAERALEKLPDRDFICMTWSGGASSVSKADWSPLFGREVVVWPDNDEAGFRAANQVCDELKKGCASKICMVERPELFAKLPEKWDLADPLPEGIKASSLSFRIFDNRKDRLQNIVFEKVGSDRKSATEKLRTAHLLYHFEKQVTGKIQEELSQDLSLSQKEQVWRKYGMEAMKLLEQREEIIKNVSSDPQVNASGVLAERLSFQIQLFEAKNGHPPESHQILQMKEAILEYTKDMSFMKDSSARQDIKDLAIDRSLESVCVKALKGHEAPKDDRHLFECAVHKEVAEISKQKELEIVQNQAIEKQQAMEKDLSKGLSL